MVSPGLIKRQVSRGIGLTTRVRLHVGVVGAEQFLGAIDGELLGDVDEFAAAVIALARITFGVLVGQHRTLGLEHARTGVVFRGDQLDVIFLALALAVDGGIQLGVKTTHSHRGTEHFSGLGRVATGGANCSGRSGAGPAFRQNSVGTTAGICGRGTAVLPGLPGPAPSRYRAGVRGVSTNPG